ncbi:hypothetical protein SAMN05421503_1818 [Terribacillus aidingensis]|uniref:Uncharacterized protein n=1 Tax=Terribacillus aidingensis TaxID=586416 RepID=A0A285NMC1_9BACI|nr:hypothetical protein [Terribacillus aidingensis]SNZ10642.1 hypothetical protein SAMN05421503_1818 [Terribacillus aidingensis]
MGSIFSIAPFPTERVKLNKKSGEIIKDIEALVQSNDIFIEDISLPIEEGDSLIRELKNGLKESYIVIDRGFVTDSFDLDAHYQVEVEKISSREIRQQNQVSNKIVYNLNGANSRVNNNSTDNSLNIVNSSPDELFDKLREQVSQHIEDPEIKRSLRQHISEMEANQDSPNFTVAYTKFINSIASHMTIFSPFIPALTQMLSN